MTPTQRSLSRTFLIYQVFTNLWFISAVWLYFYRLYINDQQIGMLDACAFAIGLLAEVPSGALADRFGRDKLVRLGHVLAGAGFLIQAFGHSFVPFFVGQAILMVGVAFVSGADDALFFERLNFDKASASWRKLVTRGTQASLVASLIAIIAGGWFHTFDPRLPWIMTGVSFLLTVAIIWPIRDTRKLERGHFVSEVKEYLFHIKEGFREFTTSKFFLYVPIIITVQGLFYTAGWGLLRIVLLDRFHFSPFAGSLAVAASNLTTFIALYFLHRHAERISERQMLTVIALLAASSLLFAIADVGMWGYVVILVMYAGEHLLHPFMSEILNHRASNERRATILSVGSFLRTLPYVVLAPVIGYLNTYDQLEYFLIFWAVMIIGALLLYLTLKRRDTYVDLVHIPIKAEERMPGGL